MIEQIFELAKGNEKAVEKVVFDENVHYLHMVFNKDEGLPEHFSNSNVYMTVIRGMLSIGLNDQDIHEYEAGTLLKIPFQTKMNVKNLHNETLELIVGTLQTWNNAGAEWFARVTTIKMLIYTDMLLREHSTHICFKCLKTSKRLSVR